MTTCWDESKYGGADDASDRRRLLPRRIVGISVAWTRSIAAYPATVRRRGPATGMALLAAAVADRFVEQPITAKLRGAYSRHTGRAAG